MSECAGVTGEQINRQTVYAEIDVIAEQGFKGDIILHLGGDGSIKGYHISEFRKPGEERRVYERRTAGPRDGGDRRKH